MLTVNCSSSPLHYDDEQASPTGDSPMFFLQIRGPPRSTPLPHPTPFRTPDRDKVSRVYAATPMMEAVAVGREEQTPDSSHPIRNRMPPAGGKKKILRYRKPTK